MGPKGDLTLDMGAYRYMPLAQPLITDIVERLLELPNRLYQVSVFSCNLFVYTVTCELNVHS